MSKRFPWTAVLAVSVLCVSPVGAAEPAAPAGDKLLIEKCNFCHTAKRINTMDPAKVKETVERMRKMNPDWITDVQSEHVVKVIAEVLKDGNVAMQRQAWNEAVDRGAALFKDTKLGTNEYSCAACHTTQSLVNVADSYPRWDAKRKGFVDLRDTISYMITEKLGGKAGADDQRLFDLIAYLKTLK